MTPLSASYSYVLQDPIEYYRTHPNRFQVLELLGAKEYEPGMRIVEYRGEPAILTAKGEYLQDGEVVGSKAEEEEVANRIRSGLNNF